MGSERGKLAGPATQPQAEGLGPSASLAPQAPQKCPSKEFELQDDQKGTPTPLI